MDVALPAKRGVADDRLARRGCHGGSEHGNGRQADRHLRFHSHRLAPPTSQATRSASSRIPPCWASTSRLTCCCSPSVLRLRISCAKRVAAEPAWRLPRNASARPSLKKKRRSFGRNGTSCSSY